MIDTISLHIAGRNNEHFQINESVFRKQQNEEGRTDILYNTFYDKDKKRAIYVTNNVKDNYALLQFSAPKLLYGNSLENVKLEHTEKLEGILQNRLNGIFDTDFMNSKVSRLDVTQNIEVENEIPLYVHSLEKAYSGNKRYRVEKFSDETLTIKNNSRRILVYDKVREALENKDITRQEAKAYGNILRLEVQHKKGKHIQTSFNRLYTLTDILTDDFFRTAKNFHLKMFDNMFCNSGNYELFMQDVALMQIVTNYNKKGRLKNFVLKSLTDKYEHEHNIKEYEELLKLSGMSKDGIRKAINELQRILRLSKTRTSDIIEEVRIKLTA